MMFKKKGNNKFVKLKRSYVKTVIVKEKKYDYDEFLEYLKPEQKKINNLQSEFTSCENEQNQSDSPMKDNLN